MSKQSAPRVAILLATHNDGPMLHEAIESLLRGSYPVEIFVVDDCSREPVKVRQANVKVLRLEQNVGLTRALNHGLAHIKPLGYEYVGRMDADDISRPERIAAQVAFLQANEHISGVGTWANFIEAKSKETVFRYMPPCDPESIRRELSYNSCLLHPAWLMRSKVFEVLDGYDPDFPVAQDFEFLARGSWNGMAFANLPQVLVDYRISPSGISVKRRREQLFARLRVQVRYFRPGTRAAWLGVAKTVLLFGVPAAVLRRVKARRSPALAES